ncbi:MAG: polymer-forming cytoskeletal protein [bacterium]
MVAKQKELPPTREVVCTHCDHPIQIPATAMSVNCRHCNRRVIIEDLKIKAYHAALKVATAGKLEVAKNAQVVADIRVAELVVDGAVKGSVKADDRVQIGKKGVIQGDILCRRILVEPGGRLEGRLSVGPNVWIRPKDPSG